MANVTAVSTLVPEWPWPHSTASSRAGERQRRGADQTRWMPTSTKLSAILSISTIIQTTVFAIFFLCLCSWRLGIIEDYNILETMTNPLDKAPFVPDELQGMHFVPASDPKIKYVGRWLHTSTRDYRDSYFAGSYLEFDVHNCSSIYISLQDAYAVEERSNLDEADSQEMGSTAIDFHPIVEDPSRPRSSAPASLLSQIDGQQARIYRIAGSEVIDLEVQMIGDWQSRTVRLTVLAGPNGQHSAVRVEGFWRDDYCSMISLEPKRRLFNLLTAPKTSPGLIRPFNIFDGNASTAVVASDVGNESPHKNCPSSVSSSPKLLEIVTDVDEPASNGTSGTVVPELVSWERLLGQWLGIDHFRLTLGDTCLVTPCASDNTLRHSIKTAFFRSGPLGSIAFNRPWNFQTYVPDAMVLVLGAANERSIRHQMHESKGNRRELDRQFEEEYVNFIAAIRKAAYPLHPSDIWAYSGQADGFVYNSAPATLPIYVVSPFNGELHHSVAKVVAKLQGEGDKSTFWIDTSGWFSPEDFQIATRDKIANEVGRPLTVAGHHKAAQYMQLHLCRHLSDDEALCPFFQHDLYIGEAYVPAEKQMERSMEEMKLQRLRTVFGLEQYRGAA